MNLLRNRSRSLTLWRVLLLAGWLVAAQMLGLGHAVNHAVAQAPVSPGPLALTASADLEDRWHNGHAAGSAECRLLDQLLGHADGLPTAAAARLPVPLATRIAAHAPVVFGAAGNAGSYQARAPPGA